MSDNSVNIQGDEYGTFAYSFNFNGATCEVRDFPSCEEALKGARFHYHCLANNLPHEVRDGLGAIYRG